MTSIYLNYIEGNAELFLKIFGFSLFSMKITLDGIREMFEIIYFKKTNDKIKIKTED